jgi:predicted transcriptional regulator of viral defense system
MARPTAAAVIVHFLRHVGASRVGRIARYMESQWGYPPATTRNTLSRLALAGRVARVKRGVYRIAGAGQAEHEAGALGHTTMYTK